jgi:hypothetical protein
MERQLWKLPPERGEAGFCDLEPALTYPCGPPFHDHICEGDRTNALQATPFVDCLQTKPLAANLKIRSSFARPHL